MPKPNLIDRIKEHPLTASLFALTALLLATVIVLICFLLIDRQKEDIQFYYENKCQSFSTQNTNSAKGQIVFIGDSITDLYVLDEHYADLPLAVYNRGIGGDTTEGLLARINVSVLDIAPTYVVLMIGTNDVNGNVSNDQILSNYEKILDTIYAVLPDVQIYCMSIIPQNMQLAEYTTIDVKSTTKRILQLNPQIQQLAEKKGAVYLDLFSLLADENQYLIAEYSDDGIHLNKAGLQVWTDLLKPHLQASLAHQPKE